MNPIKASIRGHQFIFGIKPQDKEKIAADRFILKLRFVAPFVATSLLTLLLLLITTHAHAATTTACQDGAAATVDGTISKFSREDGTRFYITDTSLDCGLYIVAANEQNCVLGSHIHATGKLSKPTSAGSRAAWSLTDASFSCQ